jgi:hypothetical protein
VPKCHRVPLGGRGRDVKVGIFTSSPTNNIKMDVIFCKALAELKGLLRFKDEK